MDNNKELTDIIVNNFNITSFTNELDAESDYLKSLQLALCERIIFYIRTDVEKLFQILYRIDVPQSYSDRAFELGEIQLVAMELAKLIITRQLQKVDYARKFKKESNS